MINIRPLGQSSDLTGRGETVKSGMKPRFLAQSTERMAVSTDMGIPTEKSSLGSTTFICGTLESSISKSSEGCYLKRNCM